MFDDLHRRAQRRFDPLDEAALLVGTLSPDELETGQAARKRSQQEFATGVILEVGLMHQHVHDPPSGIHEQMARASLHLFSAIIAAKPPF